MTCNSGFDVSGQLPHRANNTYVCAVNPFNSASLLKKCCQGPVTNITSPAPTSGPYSDSWPVTCAAYCAILLKPYYSDQDSVVHDNFTSCLGSDPSFFGSIVCTEVNSPEPNECFPFHESIGCTDSRTHQTWGVSGYLPLSATTTSLSTRSQAQQTTGAVAGTTSATMQVTGTSSSSPSPTKSGAAPVRRSWMISSLIATSFILQACCSYVFLS